MKTKAALVIYAILGLTLCGVKAGPEGLNPFSVVFNSKTQLAPIVIPSDQYMTVLDFYYESIYDMPHLQVQIGSDPNLIEALRPTALGAGQSVKHTIAGPATVYLNTSGATGFLTYGIAKK